MFGDLTVIKLDDKTSSGLNKWSCECVCGNFISVRSSDLRSGKTKSCGCLRSRNLPRVDLSGMVFNKLTVIDFSHKSNNRNFWNCKCDCGNMSVCATASLNGGLATQCYSCGRKFKDEGHSGLSILIKQYKHGANKRGYEWNLSRDDVKSLTSESCVYCGVKPDFRINTNTIDNYGDYIYNGIDRVDNTKGYDLDNCVSCCRLCNWMKRDLTIEEFKTHISKINNIFIGDSSD